MFGLKAIVRRLCLVGATLLVALAVTGTSVAAQSGAGMIQNTNSPQYQQEAADLRASQYLYYGYPFGYGYYNYGYDYGNPYYGYGYNGTPFYYNNSPTGQNPFTLVGCDTGNYTCLAQKGGNVYGGYPGYGYSGYGFPGYGYGNPGFSYGYAAPPSGPPLYGYALNYNFNFPYSGIPDSYFKNASCAVGDYTCLFGKLGMGVNLPDSFFAAVGCPTGNYACATSQTVFTNVGCTIGNYSCVYSKTGKMPTA